MQRLQGKVALITGGGSGIGAATGGVFCSQGAAVVLVDRDAAALEETAAALRAQTKDARIALFAADVADADEAFRAVAHGVGAFGRLDVLVNNAAARNYSAVADATRAEWQGVLEVNLCAER